MPELRQASSLNFYRSIVITVFMFLSGVVLAQSNKPKMSDAQKAQAAKADVYIVNFKKKIKDSTTTRRDTTAIRSKRNNTKPNKKSS